MRQNLICTLKYKPIQLNLIIKIKISWRLKSNEIIFNYIEKQEFDIHESLLSNELKKITKNKETFTESFTFTHLLHIYLHTETHINTHKQYH